LPPAYYAETDVARARSSARDNAPPRERASRQRVLLLLLIC